MGSRLLMAVLAILAAPVFVGCGAPSGAPPSTGSGGAGVGGAGGSASTGTGGGRAGIGGSPSEAGGGTGRGDDAGTGGGNDATVTPPTDGGDDGGAPPAGCASGNLCFDFDSETAGGKPAAPWTGMGTIDSTRAVSGKNALRVPAGGDGAFAMIAPTAVLPNAANEYYGRVMFWTDAVPGNHWTFVRSRGAVMGKAFTAEYTYGGSGRDLIANYDTVGAASDCWKTGGAVPLGKWTCMEWHFKGATNELELWIDGVADDGAHVVGKGDGCVNNGTAGVWYAPTFVSLELGFASYGATAGFSVWYDDLVLGKTRVGCAK